MKINIIVIVLMTSIMVALSAPGGTFASADALISLPDKGINGDWIGTGEQHDTASSWTMQVRIQDETFIIDYPSLFCGGSWKVIDANPERIKLKESLEYGKNYCIDNGTIVLEKVDRNKMHYTWFYGGEVGAEALLDRADGSEALSQFREVYNNATSSFKDGRFEEALGLYKRAVKLQETALGPQHPAVPAFLHGLGRLLMERGFYVEAEHYYKHALEVSIRANGANHYRTANALYDLGVFYMDLDNIDSAKKLIQQSLEITRAAYGARHPAVASKVSSLGDIALGQGDIDGAGELYSLSMSIYSETLFADHANIGIAARRLALILTLQGKHEKALVLYQKGLSIAEKWSNGVNSTMAYSYKDIASCFERMGDYSESERYYLKALNVASQVSDINALWSVQDGLSRILYKKGYPSVAIFWSKQAVNNLQNIRSLNISMEKSLQNSFLRSREYAYRNLADMLIEQGRLPEAQQVLAMLKEEEYFDFVRRDVEDKGKLCTRAAYTTEEAHIFRKYETLSNQLASLGKEIATLQEKQKRKSINPAERERLSVLTESMSVANQQFMSYLRQIIDELREMKSERLQEMGEETLKTLTSLKGTLKSLGGGAVVLHYLITEEKLKILLTTPNIQISRETVINKADLNRKVSAYRQVLSNPKADPLPLAQELYRIMLNPVAEDLRQEEAKVLMLSLDGVLRYIPVAALHDGRQYVAEVFQTVIFTDATKDKLILPPSSEWSVAGFGVSRQIAGYKPLPAVKGELNAIVRTEGGLGVLPGEIYLDEAFTDISLRRMIMERQYPVVHIASHFVFKVGQDLESYLLLGDGGELTLEKIKRGAYDFNSVELLTLSACETAVGGRANGREIEGFGALAQNQGAKAVLATLWPVADESTGLLMQKMYQIHEQQKVSKVEALQRAQMAFIKGQTHGVGKSKDKRGEVITMKVAAGNALLTDTDAPYAHPYFWAPFILMGNWK